MYSVYGCVVEDIKQSEGLIDVGWKADSEVAAWARAFRAVEIPHNPQVFDGDWASKGVVWLDSEYAVRGASGPLLKGAMAPS